MELLQLLHTNTCGPFHDKSESLDIFKIVKAEVENQLNKRIKSVRSDRAGEFYARNGASGEQCPRSFA